MASGRAVSGCILLLFLGFMWAPIWILTQKSEDNINVNDLFVVDEADADTRVKSSREPPTKSTSDHSPKRLPKVDLQHERSGNIKSSVISKWKNKPRKNGINPTVKTVGHGAEDPPAKEGSQAHYNGTVKTVGVTVGLDGQANGNITVDYGGIETARITSTNVCSQMTLLRNSTFRWIIKVCGTFKRHSVYLRAGILMAVGLASLLVTLIAYKLMCPRVYNREGVEKIYDMEDSWLIFH